MSELDARRHADPHVRRAAPDRARERSRTSTWRSTSACRSSIPPAASTSSSRPACPLFRKYDADGQLLFERHVEGPELDDYLRHDADAAGRRGAPKTATCCRSSRRPSATAGVDREGKLWIALTVAVHLRLRRVGRQDPHGAVQRRQRADPEQPVLHEGRPRPRHAGLLRVRVILRRAHGISRSHEDQKTTALLGILVSFVESRSMRSMIRDGEEESGPAEEGRGGLGRADAGGSETGRRPARSTSLAAQVEDEGGSVLGQYNDPFGGKPLLIVALPVGQRRADALPARSVRRARQAADGRRREDRPLPRSDHRHPPRGQVLDAERQSPAAGAEEARRPHGRRAARARIRRSRSRSSRSTPRRRTTCARSRSRRSAWRARSPARRRRRTSTRAASPSSSSSRRSSRSAPPTKSGRG